MQTVIRMLLSGIIGGIAALTTVKVTYEMISPDGTPTPLGMLLFGYKELILFMIIFALIYFTVAKRLSCAMAMRIERAIRKYSMQEILMYIIGVSIGLAIANLVVQPFLKNESEVMVAIWCALLYVGLSYFGVYIVHLKKEELTGWFSKKTQATQEGRPKILDTSVIIDGRILDIIKTGFIEGVMIIPTFVLDELQHIADSSDKLKRTRGRRGLDVIRDLQQVKNTHVEIMSIQFKDIKEVDRKLIKLATQLQGAIITNDLNLNKVAVVEQVTVLNINDLANAVKPVILPNETMTVVIAKEGREAEQGLAYLNDGTMIVVEGGKHEVGNTVTVMVTSALQTSAGRMIFAKILK